MEYPELVMVVDDPTSVAHEVAHQWFYGLVGSDQWREPWLDESLATFAQRRLLGTLRRLRRAPAAGDSGRARASTSTMAVYERAPETLRRGLRRRGLRRCEALRPAWGRARFDALRADWVGELPPRRRDDRDFVALVRRLAPPRLQRRRAGSTQPNRRPAASPIDTPFLGPA